MSIVFDIYTNTIYMYYFLNGISIIVQYRHILNLLFSGFFNRFLKYFDIIKPKFKLFNNPMEINVLFLQRFYL